MDYRPLGRAGVQVSQMCLGAMMFGAFGNTDHDASVPPQRSSRPCGSPIGAATDGSAPSSPPTPC
jgi:hypothetical protein